jgi:poly(hydroxyalkanoate) depolymerase family esterase
MLKDWTRLWLKGMKQATRTQTRVRKQLLDTLLPSVAPAKPKRKAKPKPGPLRKPVARPAASVPPASPAPSTRDIVFPANEQSRLPGKWMNLTHVARSEAGGQSRMAYWLYIPAGAASAAMPLVVMLHGCEQSATGFAQGTRMNAVAEEKGFAVAYPQQSLRRHPNRCWPWYERTAQDGGDEVELILGIIDRVCAAYPIERSRIYLAGLSAGAGMAGIIGLNHPDRIAAVGLHSGAVFGVGHSKAAAYGVMQLGAARQAEEAIKTLMQRGGEGGAALRLPAILVHGHEDRVVRRINLEQSLGQFRLLNGLSGVDPVISEKPGRGGRRASHPYQLQDYYRGRKLMLRVCEIQHLDHAWSGGDGRVKYHADTGPDASRMMWDFFSRHRRRN